MFIWQVLLKALSKFYDKKKDKSPVKCLSQVYFMDMGWLFGMV